MAFARPPTSACWTHAGLRSGFEVAFLTDLGQSWLVEGATNALEDGVSWAATYAVEFDASWQTTAARVRSRSAGGDTEVTLEADGCGRWLVDGFPSDRLDGCLDVDLECSAFTNALPVHRLALGIGESADVPSAYVRVPSLDVERLEQRYRRLDDTEDVVQFEYEAPGFDFACRLVYDRSGLVLDYPGLASRAA
jgi:hypothetical protein